MEALPGERPDLLSLLPDDLLHHILSFLPTTEAILTSVLSRRWRHVWRSLPCLDFDGASFYRGRWRFRFPEFVGHVMSTREPSAGVRRFRLHWLRGEQDATRLAASWVEEGLHGGLRELDLRLDTFDGFPLERVLHRAPSLEVLRLKTNMFHHHNHLVFQEHPRPLRRLRTLKLVGFESEDGDDAWLERLVAMCPVLEELALICFSCGRRLRLVAPKLVRLTAFDRRLHGSQIQVEAPNLRHVNGLPWQEKPWLLTGPISSSSELGKAEEAEALRRMLEATSGEDSSFRDLIRIRFMLRATGPHICR